MKHILTLTLSFFLLVFIIISYKLKQELKVCEKAVIRAGQAVQFKVTCKDIKRTCRK